MNKNSRLLPVFFGILGIAVFVFVAYIFGMRMLPVATPEPTAVPTEAPTNTPEPTEIVPPTATLAPSETPQPSVKWKLPDPPDANQLPTQLSVAIKYVEPPKDCAKENDPNVTCSTLKGQVTDGDFVLKSGQALVMTGDVINISKDKTVLVDQPSLNTNHDLWVVANATSQDMTLHMLASHGSFRGYFAPADGKWNIQKITHLRDLHLYLFLLPTQTYDRFTPTPVPNCESRFGCEEVNVRVIVFDDTGMNVAGYGLYKENQPFWQNLLQLLGQ